jgi:hypothetical protein
VQVEPLRKLPALHVAVPEKLTPRLPRIQLVLAAVLPSAIQSSVCPSYAVEGVAKEYTVEETEESVGDSAAATQLGLGAGE